MTREQYQVHQDLRHDTARRRAGAGRYLEQGREARDRAPAGQAARGHHRGRVPDRLSRRLRGGQGDRDRGQGPARRRSGAGHRGGHPGLLGRRQGRRGAAHPHVHQHQPGAHEVPDQEDAGRGARRHARHGLARARPGRHASGGRPRVQRHGREPLRPRVPGAGARPRRPVRRDHHQRARHGRLRAAARVRRLHPRAVPAGALAARCARERALPQRPRAGHGQLAGRGAGRRHAGRVRRQRHRRARRQRLARGGRHGDPHPRRVLRQRDGRGHQGDRAHQPPGELADRLRGPAQQGHRRPQRVRARERHPPGRRAQRGVHLRDHDARRRRPRRQRHRARQAQRAPRAARQAGRPRLHAVGRRARRRVQEVQRGRGQEEGGHRARPRGAGERGDP